MCDILSNKIELSEGVPFDSFLSFPVRIRPELPEPAIEGSLAEAGTLQCVFQGQLAALPIGHDLGEVQGQGQGGASEAHPTPFGRRDALRLPLPDVAEIGRAHV